MHLGEREGGDLMSWRKHKLRPSQPFFVFATDKFYQEVYLKQGISHFYTFYADDAKTVNRVPDGCTDLIFEISGDRTKGYACGSVLHCDGFCCTDGPAVIFGIRFLPGVKPAILTVQMKDLVGKKIPLETLIADTSILEAVGKEATFEGRIQAFLRKYAQESANRLKSTGRDEIVGAIKDMVYAADGKIRIAELQDRTGYSERYINRVFMEEVGFSPKRFCKIIQFQRSIELLNYGQPENMANAASFLGYYDQPQFTRDFSYCAGLTPKQYMELAVREGYCDRVEETHLI